MVEWYWQRKPEVTNLLQCHFVHGTVFHGLMFNWEMELLALSVRLFVLLTGFVRFSDGSQFTSCSPVAATGKKRKWSGNCLKWVCSVVFNFSAKILRCPETVLVSAEFNSCQSVADWDGLECVPKHIYPSVCLQQRSVVLTHFNGRARWTVWRAEKYPHPGFSCSKLCIWLYVLYSSV